MQNKIFRYIGLQFYEKIIVIDSEKLWRRFSCDEALAVAEFKVQHIADEMELRRYYEWNVVNSLDEKYLFVLDDQDIYVPSDIKKQFYVQKLTYRLIFPLLDTDVIKGLPGLDYSRLLVYEEYFGFHRMSQEATLKLCTDIMMKDPKYAQIQIDKAEALSKIAASHRDWNEVAQLYGEASHYHNSVKKLEEFEEKRQIIEACFREWIHAKYNALSGSVDKQRPVLLSKTADYIRKESSKIALIVMDGMSFDNFYAIKEHFVKVPLEFHVSSSFSFLPTVTSVARQSIFSGHLPREHEKPFSLDNEEKQWREYWKSVGLKDNDIGYYKTDKPDYNPHMKAVGIIINICDELMHVELQGMKGLNQGLENWLNTGILEKLLKELLADGFSVFMTSDHGNTAAIAQGRFTKPGLLAEPASRRAVIYKSFDDALELKRFQTIKYNGNYLPDGYDAYLFDMNVCYGDKDKEYITHGGMTIEEVIVPFVRIGEYGG